jgi:hypothetical protein
MLTREQLQQIRQSNRVGAKNKNSGATINSLLDEIERLQKEREDLEIYIENTLPMIEQVELRVHAQNQRIQELETFIGHINQFMFSLLSTF